MIYRTSPSHIYTLVLDLQSKSIEVIFDTLQLSVGKNGRGYIILQTRRMESSARHQNIYSTTEAGS
jgi:hypothetical protein